MSKTVFCFLLVIVLKRILLLSSVHDKMDSCHMYLMTRIQAGTDRGTQMIKIATNFILCLSRIER